MINLNQLRSFYMAAKFGSVTIAAEKMFVTPPAVSMQIKKLESWLGFPLLQKEKNHLKLRGEAREIYNYAETIFSNVEQLELFLNQQELSKKGELVLGTDHMLARFIVPHIINRLKKYHSNLKFKVILGRIPDLVNKLLDQEIQCVLLASIPHPEKIKTLPLFDEDLILVAAKNSKFVHNWQIATKDLVGLPLLMLSHDTNTYRLVKEYLELNDVTPDIAMDNLSGDAILGFLLQDLGVAFSMRFTVQEHLDNGSLREIKVKGGLPTANFGLAFLHEDCRHPQLCSLVSWVEKTTLKRSHFV